MFVSDAHLFVPREVRWNRIMAIRFSAARRRKSLARRLKRDARTLLPALALTITFGTTVLTAEFATLLVPTGAAQSPAAEAMQESVARLFAPPPPPPPASESHLARAEVAPLDGPKTPEERLAAWRAGGHIAITTPSKVALLD